MVNVRRILRDYADAGALNSVLAIWGFVDDGTFITKAGDIGVVYRIAGVDYEGCDHPHRRDIVHRFEAAVRQLDERYRVYQYLLKRRVEPFTTGTCPYPIAEDAIRRRTAYLNERRADLYDLDLYLVILTEGVGAPRTSTRLTNLIRDPRRAFTEWLRGATAITVLEHTLQLAVAALHHTADTFQVQLADSVHPTRLTKGEAFGFFRRLVNYAPHKVAGAALTYDTHLDYFVADSAVECHRSHLDVDDWHVKVLTMKEPPGHTFAHLLEDLYHVPGEFIACLEWRRIPSDRMRRDIKGRQRHFFLKRTSAASQASTSEPRRDAEMLIDASADATVHQLGDALTQMEVEGHVFGECSLTVAVYDRDMRLVDRAAAGVIKVMAAHDGVFVEETYNVLNAWLGLIPGNHAHNLRRLALLDVNYADLSFLFTLDRGQAQSAHLGREALAIFETKTSTPYAWNLHYHDVGHALITGATGSGKSFFLNFLVTMAQRYDPFTVIFDLGHSYRKLAALMEGSYLELGGRHEGVRLNPFALDPTPENLHFLHAFVRVLLEGRGALTLTDAEDRELYDAITNLYVLDRAQRRLFTVANMLPRAMSLRLAKWIEGGRYGGLFDHVEDTLTVQRLQVFEFEAMREYPELLEPLLFYVLHRVTDHIGRRQGLTLCVLDEAWRFIQHPTLRAYVQEALKTWRKRNAAMWLATQAVDDFASADLLRTVVESCPTKIFLANPAFNRAQYAELFQLNPMELDLIAGLVPRSHVLLKRPDIAKVLALHVDPTSYWLYTNSPVDNDRFRAMVDAHGFAAALEQIATTSA
jgi:type IV secretion system protein VirB4